MNKHSFEVMADLYRQSEPTRWTSCVYGYHITPRKNLESILRNGLRAASIERFPMVRQEAVYFFARREDAYDKFMRAVLFGEETDLIVIKIRIPLAGYDNMKHDGLFQMSFMTERHTTPTAVQYLDDIPAEWLEVDG